ncbi:YqiJ family protein [Dokdonella sp.]|uniref:YqiJ family protein n=1 Tax=Dokdonella sp. TaxID=2291710 RepID=UPI00260DE4AE|nr:YqiJ family protein [Dokdonella sp.]
MSLLTLPESAPFVVALGVLLLLGAVEGITLMFGASPSHWLDGFLGTDPPDGFLGWLHLGRAPVLALCAVFLTAFALGGLVLNALALNVIGHPMPWPLSVPLAVLAALPAVRACGGLIVRLVPREETYAVSFASLVGRVATMLGHARTDYPAQAKTTDRHGHTLYLMVEPDESVDDLASASDVLLVRQIHGNRFAAIPNPRPDLL